jgi:hypothetical protein
MQMEKGRETMVGERRVRILRTAGKLPETWPCCYKPRAGMSIGLRRWGLVDDIFWPAPMPDPLGLGVSPGCVFMSIGTPHLARTKYLHSRLRDKEPGSKADRKLENGEDWRFHTRQGLSREERVRSTPYTKQAEVRTVLIAPARPG